MIVFYKALLCTVKLPWFHCRGGCSCSAMVTVCKVQRELFKGKRLTVFTLANFVCQGGEFQISDVAEAVVGPPEPNDIQVSQGN